MEFWNGILLSILFLMTLPKEVSAIDLNREELLAIVMVILLVLYVVACVIVGCICYRLFREMSYRNSRHHEDGRNGYDNYVMAQKQPRQVVPDEERKPKKKTKVDSSDDDTYEKVDSKKQKKKVESSEEEKPVKKKSMKKKVKDESSEDEKPVKRKSTKKKVKDESSSEEERPERRRSKKKVKDESSDEDEYVNERKINKPKKSVDTDEQPRYEALETTSRDWAKQKQSSTARAGRRFGNKFPQTNNVYDNNDSWGLY